MNLLSTSVKRKPYRVDVLETQVTGPQKILYSFFFRDGKVTCTSKYAPEPMQEGIVVDDPNHPIMPSDGMKFMEALCVHYSGSMIRATRPQPL